MIPTTPRPAARVASALLAGDNVRILLTQQWFSLSDTAIVDALIEVPAMRRFAKIGMISDRIPDETTILAFRHLLEKHSLGEAIYETDKAHLKERG